MRSATRPQPSRQDYSTLLITRLLMISGAAIFTPKPPAPSRLIVPEAKRAGAVAVVFMGWAVAGAVVIPFMSILGEIANWRVIYGGLAVGSALAAAGVFFVLPARLHAARMSLKSWGEVVTRPAILLLLAATCLQVMGQFTLFPYLAAELRRASLADPSAIALALALYGGAGLFGSIMAARTVARSVAAKTHITALSRWPSASLRLVGVLGLARAGNRQRLHLGPRLRRRRIDAAGPPHLGRARARLRLRRAQHVRALPRPGRRHCHRRRPDHANLHGYIGPAASPSCSQRLQHRGGRSGSSAPKFDPAYLSRLSHSRCWQTPLRCSCRFSRGLQRA